MGGGGKTQTTTVDPAFNQGMLELSQEQQGWAREMYNLFKTGVDYDPNEQVTGYYEANGKFVEASPTDVLNPDYKPAQYGTVRNAGGDSWDPSLDRQVLISPAQGDQYIKSSAPDGAQFVTISRGEAMGYDPNAQTSEMQYLQQLIQANASLLPAQTDLQRSQIGLETEQTVAARELLPLTTDLSKLQISDTTAGIKERAPVRAAFFGEALKGVDVNQRMNQAQADAAAAASSAERTQIRSDARLGKNAADVDTNEMAIARSKLLGQARTGARTAAEDENFNRLRTAMATGM